MEHMAETPPLMTAAEVADTFQVSKASVSRWVKEGHLPAVELPGGTKVLRFRREDVERFLAPAQPELDGAA